MTSVKEELTDELLKKWIKTWTALLDNRERELDRREQRLREQERQLKEREETRRCAHTSLPCWFNGDEKKYRKFLKNKARKIKKQLANSKK